MHFKMLNRLRLLMSLQREWWQGCLCSFCSLAAPNEDLPLGLHRVLIQALCGSVGRARSCGLWLGSRPDRGSGLQRHRKPWCHVGAGQVSSSFIAVSFTEQTVFLDV